LEEKSGKGGGREVSASKDVKDAKSLEVSRGY